MEDLYTPIKRKEHHRKAKLATTFSQLGYQLGIPTENGRAKELETALTDGRKAEELLKYLRYTKDTNVDQTSINSQLERALTPDSRIWLKNYVSRLYAATLPTLHGIIAHDYVTRVERLRAFTNKDEMLKQARNKPRLLGSTAAVLNQIERVRKYESSVLAEPYFAQLFPSNYKRL